MRGGLNTTCSARHDLAQDPPPLYERYVPQVSTVEPQAVEGNEAGLATAVEERIEEGMPASVQADHLAVEDGVPYAPERARDLGGERGEALKGVPVAGDETSLSPL